MAHGLDQSRFYTHLKIILMFSAEHKPHGNH
jgi:hypothetical protein